MQELKPNERNKRVKEEKLRSYRREMEEFQKKMWPKSREM